MGKNPVVHFEIAGLDYEKSKDFYKSIFEWDLKEWDIGSMKYGMSSHSGEGTIGGGIMQAPPDFAKPFLTFYIMVDDLKAYLAKVEEKGGKTVIPPTPIPGIGSSAMFTDPDGNLVGLYCEKQEV